MNRGRLILRNLVWFRATHLGVLLGVVVGAAVLTGALIIGESVRRSLREQAEQRIGRTDLALASGERFFEESLAERLAAELASDELVPLVAPAIDLRGVASADGGSRRALDVAVLGVDNRFFRLAPTNDAIPAPGKGRIFLDPSPVKTIPPPGIGEVYLNPRLAEQLDAQVGDRVVLRVEPPSAVPREAILSGSDDGVQALTLEVARILHPDEFGNFDLTAGQIPRHNAFVSLADLQERLELEGQANLCLIGGGSSLTEADLALRKVWTLDDVGLYVHELETSDDREMLSARVFFDAAVRQAIDELDRSVTGIFTYLASEFTVGERSAPYSLIAALGPLGQTEAPADAAWRALVPSGMSHDEIVINRWLAEDLEASAGDALTLRFPVLQPGGELQTTTVPLRVRDVVPIEGLAADRELMPSFPGIADSESCQDWDPGVPIDLDKIRDRDEEWWDERGGTPKAFVTLAAGQKWWGSDRFGSLTAVRFAPSPTDPFPAALRAALDPAELGLSFRDVRTPALAASSPATDFGGLFLGLSFFLVGAAFLLVGLLFSLGILQRASEVGTLLAVGIPPRVLTRILVLEAAILAVIGSTLGAQLAPFYARAILAGLDSNWAGAVANATLEFHASTPTLLNGGAIAFAVAVIAAWITLRGRVRQPAVELLRQRAGVESDDPTKARRARRRSAVIGIAFALGAIALVIVSLVGPAPNRPAASFGAGTLALIAALAGCRFALLRRESSNAFRSLGALAWSNAARRPSRSLATIALLAIGAFLVIVVGAHRKGAPEDPTLRTSGTGGFELLGRSSLAFVPDRSSATNEVAFPFGLRAPEGVSVISMRVHEGDDASCLNLHRPQEPRLLGVHFASLEERDAFSFARSAAHDGNPWTLLAPIAADGAIPAIGDEASLLWSLKVGIGDTIPYVDERGNEFEVQIVGSLAGSILQGNLLIDDAHFRERFPSETGHRMFLVDTPPADAPALAAEWMRTHEELGLELVSTSARLEELAQVQNTYLLVFQLLGGLGLLLGSVGLGVVVLRNVTERRGELAVLAAVGFPAARVRRALMIEHAALLLLGTASGAIGALVAVVAMLPSIPGGFPVTPVLLLLAAMLGSGFLWVALASRFAARAPLLDTLARAR